MEATVKAACETTTNFRKKKDNLVNALRTGEADLRFYVTTVQDG